MRFVFRTDASTQIGTGHVMRCLTLADELTRQGHQCRFICREHEGHLGDLIASKGYELTLLSGSRSDRQLPYDLLENAHAQWLGAPWQQDALQTLEVPFSLEEDWLVIDHYALDYRYERQLRPYARRIMVIDDLADRAHDCDLLLDQNLGRSEADYKDLVPDNCHLMIGPRYALLRPEFLEFRERSLLRRVEPELRRIIVSMGGTDMPNTTATILRALERSPLPSSLSLDVVMGSRAPWLAQIYEFSAKSRFNCDVNIDVHNMAERMTLADLSIGAAGSTSWERCALGLPTIAASQAQNQSSILDALSGAEAAVKLSIPITENELTSSLNRFFQHPGKLVSMSKKAAQVCDGMGITRISGWLNG